MNDKFTEIKVYVEETLQDERNHYENYQNTHKGRGFEDYDIGYIEGTLDSLADVLDKIEEIVKRGTIKND